RELRGRRGRNDGQRSGGYTQRRQPGHLERDFAHAAQRQRSAQQQWRDARLEQPHSRRGHPQVGSSSIVHDVIVGLAGAVTRPHYWFIAVFLARANRREAWPAL